MRHVGYGALGAILGAIAGLFFGLIFGSSVTKASEYKTRAVLQVIICVPLGAIGGAALGLSMASERGRELAGQRRTEADRRPQAERVSRKPCLLCRKTFASPATRRPPSGLCPSCDEHREALETVAQQALHRCYQDIPKLKRIRSKLERYDAAYEAIKPLSTLSRQGVDLACGSPSYLKGRITRHKNNTVAEHITADAKAALQGARSESSTNAKVRRLQRFLEQLDSYKQMISGRDREIEELEVFIREGIERLQNTGGDLPTQRSLLPRLLRL